LATTSKAPGTSPAASKPGKTKAQAANLPDASIPAGKPWLKSYPAGIPHEIPAPAGSIGDLLVGACKQYAGRPAFTCMGK
jgi:long-chain acyl-CoA synthetase